MLAILRFLSAPLLSRLVSVSPLPHSGCMQGPAGPTPHSPAPPVGWQGGQEQRRVSSGRTTAPHPRACNCNSANLVNSVKLVNIVTCNCATLALQLFTSHMRLGPGSRTTRGVL